MRVVSVSGRSYSVMLYIFRLLGFPVGVRILDLTYGVGRFYRKIREIYRPFIVGVDVARHRWEVEPDVFIQKDCRELSIDEVKQYGDIDVVVVDPPWSHTKRGKVSNEASYSKMPFHIPGVDPYQIIYAATRITRELGAPLIARFAEPIQGSDIVIKNSVVVFNRRGAIYYSIILNQYRPATLEKWIRNEVVRDG